MAANKVRKGFFFYLLLFILLIIAFVGVCVTIMLFNPGKDVLGFTYFKNSQEINVEKTTDETATPIDIGTKHYDSIEIDGGSFNVVLQNNTDHEKNGIYIVNDSRGFMKTSDRVDLEYSVVEEGNNLKIKADAQNGFLNLSHNVSILIHYGKVKTDILKDTKLIIRTTTGSVNIGGVVNTAYSEDIYPGALDIETDSGSITLTQHSTNIYKSIKLKTNSGSIDVSKVEDKVNTEEKDNSLQSLDGVIDIDSNSGIIELGKIKSRLNLCSDSGTIRASLITGNVDIKATSCIIDVEKVIGNVDFANSSEIMNSCKVYITEITGTLNIPQGRDSFIQVKKLNGATNIHTTSGNIELGTSENEVNSSVYLETTSGNITTYLGGNGARFFITENGDVNLKFVNSLKGYSNIETNKGKTSIVFNQDSKAKFEFKLKNETEENKFNLESVSFDIFEGKKITGNPYYFNCVDATKLGSVEVTTNSSVILDLA